jgi:hypothetical protein
LIAAIFQEAVLEEGQEANSADLAMIVSQVCHSWRLVALSSKRLWANINLSFPRTVKRYIHRSQPLPFHMRFHLKSAQGYSSDSVKLLSGALVHVFESSYRLSSIDLHMPNLGAFFSDHFGPLLMQMKPHFPILESIKADFAAIMAYPGGGSGYRYARPFIYLLVVNGAPFLKHLYMKKCFFPEQGARIIPHMPLRTLHVMDRESQYNWHEFLQGISETLTEFHVDGSATRELCKRPVVLPKLERLLIIGKGRYIRDSLAGILCRNVVNLDIRLTLGVGFDGNPRKADNDFILFLIAWMAETKISSPGSNSFYVVNLHEDATVTLSNHDDSICAQLNCLFTASSFLTFIQSLPKAILERVFQLELSRVNNEELRSTESILDEQFFTAIGPFLPKVLFARVEEQAALALLHAWCQKGTTSVFPGIKELTLRELMLKGEKDHKCRTLVSALRRREEHINAEAPTHAWKLGKIFFGDGCSLKSSIRDEIGARYRVFFQGEEIPLGSSTRE